MKCFLFELFSGACDFWILGNVSSFIFAVVRSKGESKLALLDCVLDEKDYFQET